MTYKHRATVVEQVERFVEEQERRRENWEFWKFHHDGTSTWEEVSALPPGDNGSSMMGGPRVEYIPKAIQIRPAEYYYTAYVNGVLMGGKEGESMQVLERQVKSDFRAYGNAVVLEVDGKLQHIDLKDVRLNPDHTIDVQKTWLIERQGNA